MSLPCLWGALNKKVSLKVVIPLVLRHQLRILGEILQMLTLTFQILLVCFFETEAVSFIKNLSNFGGCSNILSARHFVRCSKRSFNLLLTFLSNNYNCSLQEVTHK